MRPSQKYVPFKPDFTNHFNFSATVSIPFDYHHITHKMYMRKKDKIQSNKKNYLQLKRQHLYLDLNQLSVYLALYTVDQVLVYCGNKIVDAHVRVFNFFVCVSSVGFTVTANIYVIIYECHELNSSKKNQRKEEKKKNWMIMNPVILSRNTILNAFFLMYNNSDKSMFFKPIF